MSLLLLLTSSCLSLKSHLLSTICHQLHRSTRSQSFSISEILSSGIRNFMRSFQKTIRSSGHQPKTVRETTSYKPFGKRDGVILLQSFDPFGIPVERWEDGTTKWCHWFHHLARSLPLPALALIGRIQIYLQSEVTQPPETQVRMLMLVIRNCILQQVAYKSLPVEYV